MAPPNNNLAPSSGSVLQFVLASLPLLAVFCYFLFLAYTRPSEPVYNVSEEATDDEVRQAESESGAMIPLSDMLVVFLTFMVVWGSLAVYVLLFVPMRRRLVKRYLRDGVSTIGDVHFDETSSRGCVRNAYGFVTYTHPDRKDHNVRKKVRVYKQYTRERVAILRLPGKPYSGLPKADLELDLLTSSQERDRTRFLGIFSLIWSIFLLVSPIYLLLQMSKIDDDYEDQSWGWKLYMVFVGIVLPVVALGGNWLRWLSYRHWLLKSATVYDSSHCVVDRRDISDNTNDPESPQDISCKAGDGFNFSLMGDSGEDDVTKPKVMVSP